MKIKKILFLSLIIFTTLLIPNVVNAAETIDTNGITWVYDLQNEQATNLIPKDKSTLPADLTIPSELDGYPVTSIGNNAFLNCSSLTSIILPDSLVSIGQGVFYQCNSLENITLSANLKSIGIQAFFNCNSLKSITIPDSVTTIARGAFSGCTALKTVIIPSSVTIIDDDVFISCDLLTLTIEGYPGSVIKDYADFYDIEFKPIYKVTNKLTNITIANESFENDYKATLRADAGFILPQNISVRVGAIDLASDEYTYNSTNGELMVPEELIVGDIEIEAIGEKIHKITFDANGGEFSGGDNILYFNDAKEFNFDELESPIKSGYKFIGYYTEKTGGTSLENIMNSEAGIEDDIIFYARWEEIPKQENVTKEEPSKELDESPKMGNDNRNFAFEITLLSICFVTVISFSVYNKKSSK